MAPCDACKLFCWGRFCDDDDDDKIDDGDDNIDDDDDIIDDVDDNIDDGIHICKSRVWALPAGRRGPQREIQIGV